MENAPLPLNLLAGNQHLNKDAPGWTLLGPPSHQMNRRFVHEVVFEREFQSAPVVHVGLTGFDIENHDFARLKIHAAGIRPDGFAVVAETWFDTQIHGLSISWLAIGA